MALTKVTQQVSSTPGISDNSDATAITIDSSENVLLSDSLGVGTGTTAPNSRLQIKKDGTGNYANQTFSNANSTAGITFGIAGSGTGNYLANNAFLLNTGASAFIFGTGDTEKMRITSDGKLGIGTTSPAVMLDVRGEVAVDYNASYGLRFYNQSRNNWASIGNPSTSSDADMVFKSGGGEAMKILHNGRVGIGTSSPGYRFHLKDTGNGTIYQMEAAGGNNVYKAFTNTGGTSYIGTENQDWKFYVGGTPRFEVTSSGGQDVSDQKFKKDIEDISYGLDTVKALKPRKFKWKDSQENGIGFIAQEVQPIISEIIKEPTVTPPEGMETGMSMNYSALTAILTKAVQELSTKLEAAEARITTLEG